ncbi:MAG: hypothetical protein KC416_03110 [Myxococcales bacterium]|nr:hypothetical protein [Myxococcales bacterium]
MTPKAFDSESARYAGRALGLAMGLVLSVGCAAAEEPTFTRESLTQTQNDEVVTSLAPSTNHAHGSVDGDAGDHDDHGFSLPAEHHLDAVLARADFVGEVTVKAIHSRYGVMGRAQSEAIWTDVEFEAGDFIKDRTGLASRGSFSLPFLGGRVGERSMRIDHMPEFEVGMRAIVILRADETPSPTYSGQYGVLPIRDGRVMTYFGHLLTGIHADGYEVLTPADKVAPAPAIEALGDASGEMLNPEVGSLDDAMTVPAALAALAALQGGAS